MIVSVKVDVEKVRRQLGALTGVLRNPRGILRQVADWMLGVARAAFGKQASPEGQAWAPLSPRYALRKARLFGARRGILQATGALGRTLFAGTEANRAFVEGTVPYAGIHQHGGIAGRRGPFKTNERAARRGIFGPHGRRPFLPARPYLPGPALTEREGALIVEENLREAIRKGE